MIRIAALVLLTIAAPVAAQESVQPETLAFDMLIAGQEQVSWTLHADGTGEALLRNIPDGVDQREERRIALAAPDGDYAWAVTQLARYRALAVAAPGCTITAEGVMAFRLIWQEDGQSHVASFSDNCGGIPTDFFDEMRPLGQRMEGWQRPDAPPPSP